MSGNSNHLNSWTKFLHALTGFISKLVWLIIIIIILATLGRYFIFGNKDEKQLPQQKKTRTISVTPSTDWSKVDQSIADTLKRAYDEAHSYATKELQEYNSELKSRIDNNFLEWYFGYWNQQELGIKGLYHEAWHYFDKTHPDAKEEITTEVQEEFAKRVLRPAISQMRLEQIMQDTVRVYLQHLRKGLADIPKNYNITPEEWDRHLQSIAVTTVDVDGNRQVDLSLKTLALGTAAGTVVAVKALAPFAKNLGTKVSAALAGKAGAKLAAKTGAKVAAKSGGKLLGPIIGIGIIIWDLWDHKKTREENEPILRQNLYDYVDLMTEELLNDPKSGVMAPVMQVEKRVLGEL